MKQVGRFAGNGITQAMELPRCHYETRLRGLEVVNAYVLYAFVMHFVGSTWDRLPLIEAKLEPSVHAAIAAKCRELKCVPLEVNGTENHVHVVARMHSTISVADLAKGMKGSTSHLTTHAIRPNEFFKWQGSYGAYTVSESDLPRVLEYVRNQKKHHASGNLNPEWERTAEDPPSP